MGDFCRIMGDLAKTWPKVDLARKLILASSRLPEAVSGWNWKTVGNVTLPFSFLTLIGILHNLKPLGGLWLLFKPIWNQTTMNWWSSTKIIGLKCQWRLDAVWASAPKFRSQTSWSLQVRQSQVPQLQQEGLALYASDDICTYKQLSK